MPTESYVKSYLPEKLAKLRGDCNGRLVAFAKITRRLSHFGFVVLHRLNLATGRSPG